MRSFASSEKLNSFSPSARRLSPIVYVGAIGLSTVLSVRLCVFARRIRVDLSLRLGRPF